MIKTEEARMTRSKGVTKHGNRSSSSNPSHSSNLRLRHSFGIQSVMRAAVLTSPGRVDIVEAPIPKPDSSQILVRLEGCGVCASNVPPWEGKPWFTYPMPPGALGHEAWGRIEEVGSAVRDFQKADRVAVCSTHAYAD